jgi:hypothetical protein
VGLFEIEVHLAGWAAAELQPSAAALGPVVVLAGDASVTAHYRLGVGVNHAYSNLRDFATMLAALLTELAAPVYEQLVAEVPPPAHVGRRQLVRSRAAVDEYAAAAARRGGNMVQFQLFSMFFEAHCGLVVIKDRLLQRAAYADAAAGRAGRAGRAVPGVLLEAVSPAEALRACRGNAQGLGAAGAQGHGNAAAKAFLEVKKASADGSGAKPNSSQHSEWPVQPTGHGAVAPKRPQKQPKIRDDGIQPATADFRKRRGG